MKISAQPQIEPGAEIKQRMLSVAGDLLTEKLVPEALRDGVWIEVGSEGRLLICKSFLEEEAFRDYLDWVRSTPEISESVSWDDTIPPGEYEVPEGTTSKMVRSVVPYREKYRSSEGEIYGRAVEIYRRMRGKPKVDGLSSYMGGKLARSECGFNEETLEQLEENVDRVTSQILDKKSGGSGAVEILLDETWKKVLNILWEYGIAEATLEEDGDTLTVEGKEKFSDVRVKAELQGPATKGSELEKLGVSVETLFKALKIFGTPCQIEGQREDGVMKVCSLDPSRIDSDLPVEKTLSVKRPVQGEALDLDTEHSVEAESVDLWFLRAAERIHGVEGFQATIGAEDGKLLLNYWTEDSTAGLRSILGEAQGDEVSSTYRPELLEPLEGEWNLKLGADLPLRAEKAIEKGEGGREADVTVIVPPKVENTGISFSESISPS